LFSSLDSLILSQFLSLNDLPPDTPIPKVCTPADAPARQTSEPVLVTFGAAAVGGADLMLDVELFVVVELEELPDSYVVDVVYPPVIEVFDPDVLFCVVSADTHVVNKSSKINILIYFHNQFTNFCHKDSFCTTPNILGLQSHLSQIHVLHLLLDT
jgi:hypothetical protein